MARRMHELLPFAHANCGYLVTRKILTAIGDRPLLTAGETYEAVRRCGPDQL
jgi:hypothetical protein